MLTLKAIMRGVLMLGAIAIGCAQPDKPPHILFIVADDVGYNDVSWHNPDVKMPVLDKLANEGVILEQSYVQYLCSPSRTGFMTGYFPYHVGTQHQVILPHRPQYVPKEFTFLPEKLRELDYATHIVGKWHLGYCNWKYTPTYRGFDSFYGYYNAGENYYNHTVPISEDIIGLDLRDNKDLVRTKRGQYGPYFFTERAVEIIDQHPAEKPLFLYLPFQIAHNPLQVPQQFEDMHTEVQDKGRRTFLGMLSALDEAVGNVIEAMKNARLWDNTLVIFTTDNGGWIDYSGNNYPLRGGKFTLWEGGTRGVAFVHGKMLEKTGYINEEMIHAVDWFPTILEAAGGTADAGIDGISQLETIMYGKPSPRTGFVYNIDDVFPNNQGAIRDGDYKLIMGNAGKPDGWIQPPDKRAASQSKRNSDDPHYGTWLFNLKDDPEERFNLADTMPFKLMEMHNKLKKYKETMVPAQWPPVNEDSYPENWNGAWSPGWC